MAVVQVIEPATGHLMGEVPEDTAAGVRAAVDRARAAQPGWAALGFETRARALRRLARRLMNDAELVSVLSRESGKPAYEAEAIEVFYTCELTRYLTGRAGRRALADDVRHPLVFANKRARVVYHPRGVVAVIGPWNWPLLNNFADAIAPLAAGNAVVLKPSPQTPLTSLHVARLWRDEGLPGSVLEVVIGGREAGEALTATADHVFFTGSQATGRAVARACADRLVPCALELGGKSAMIVLADADVARAARAAVWSAFAHSGQVCIRTERVLVEESVADAFVAACREHVLALRQGAVLTDEIDVGAMTWPDQIDHVEAQLAEAVAKGARVATGGQRRADLPGRFFAPTLLVDVTPDMAVAREETFGPLLPVIRVRDAEHAIALANDSPFGLSGSVWSRDARRGSALARRMIAGSVCVNDTLVNYFCVEAPLGGVRASGLGTRHGPESLRQFCRIETIIEDRAVTGWLSPAIGRALTFPYRRSVLRAIRFLMRRLY